jgi:dTDP-4-dehydrorhamnose reductase
MMQSLINGIFSRLMKIFLTGASGILGTDIENFLKLENNEVIGYNSAGINIGNYRDVKSKVQDFKPDIVIHCAAMTNVDQCEVDKQGAVLTNIIGAKNLSLAADQVNAKIIYISSCGVYGNGKTSAYTELDKPEPVNYHHFTKLEGEKAVKEHNNQFLIIRPGWLFGGTVLHKKNFVEARRKEAEGTSLLKSAGDKFGSPTYTADLARQINILINNDIGGTYNAVNSGCASRYDYVSEIVQLLELPVIVEPTDSSLFPRKANMPDNECLENFNLELCGLNNMREWREALKDYIYTTYLK